MFSSAWSANSIA